MRAHGGRVYCRCFGTLLPDHPSSHLSFQKKTVAEKMSEPSTRHCAGSLVSEGARRTACSSQDRMQSGRALVS
jgi:hypothetical protein